MDILLSFLNRVASDRIRCMIAVMLLLGTVCIGAVAENAWQPVDVKPWVQIDTPPGWTSMPDKTDAENPDSGRITAYSPGDNARLKYILDHTTDTMSLNEIRQFQSSYMSKLGFRICMTKDPVILEGADQSLYQQVYVRGTGDAAVIGTLSYPGWGQAHYVLIMEGKSAVDQYYESLPPVMGEHIRPVISSSGEEAAA